MYTIHNIIWHCYNYYYCYCARQSKYHPESSWFLSSDGWIIIVQHLLECFTNSFFIFRISIVFAFFLLFFNSIPYHEIPLLFIITTILRYNLFILYWILANFSVNRKVILMKCNKTVGNMCVACMLCIVVPYKRLNFITYL